MSIVPIACIWFLVLRNGTAVTTTPNASTTTSVDPLLAWTPKSKTDLQQAIKQCLSHPARGSTLVDVKRSYPRAPEGLDDEPNRYVSLTVHTNEVIEETATVTIHDPSGRDGSGADGRRYLARLELDLVMEPDDLAPLFDGTGWAGTMVWEAALIMSRLLVGEAGRALCRGRRVVELGAGLGAPGMVAGSVGAAEVVLTEQPKLVPLLRNNIAKNDFGACKVSAEVLDWGVEASRSLRERWFGGAAPDLLLVCDCIFEPLYGLSWKALIQTIAALSAPGGETVTLLSVERRNGDGIGKFLAELPENDLISEVMYDFYMRASDARIQVYRLTKR